MRLRQAAQRVEIIRIGGWRSGRWYVWGYIAFGSILWCGIWLPESACAQDLSTSDAIATTTNRPLETGTMLQRAMGIAVPGADMATQPQLGFQATAQAGADFTYTDNAFLTGADRRADFIVTPQLVLDLSDTTMRTAFAADVQLDYDAYATYHSLDGLRPTALLTGLTDIVPGEFSIQARLATDLQQISPEGQTPATPRSFGDNQVQVLNFGARPTWREHFGDDVQSEVFYDFAGVRFLDSPSGPSFAQASDTIQQLGQASLSNGTTFSRFGWTLLGSYQELDPSHANSVSNPRTSQGDAEAHGQYIVASGFSLTARGGYEWFHEPTIETGNTLNGPFGLGGFIWHPDRRLNLHIEAGYRYNGFDADGQLTYHVARSLNISATYGRDLQNTQQILINNLANLTNPANQPQPIIIDPVTGLPENSNGLSVVNPPSPTPANPDQSAIGFSNISFRHDLYQAIVSGQVGRNSYNLTGDYQNYTSILGGSHSWDASASIARDLTRHLKASIEVDYSRVDGIPGAINVPGNLESETKSASMRVDYRLSRTVYTNIRYVYLWRATPLLSYRENAIMFEAIKKF